LFQDERRSEAWVTYALSDKDVQGALTLSCSMMRVLTTKNLVVIASQKLSTSMKQALHLGFDFVFYLQEDLNTAGLEIEDFVKLWALTLASFSRVVFLSPKMLVFEYIS